MDIYSWKTLSNKPRLKDLCFKRKVITGCNETKWVFLLVRKWGGEYSLGVKRLSWLHSLPSMVA